MIALFSISQNIFRSILVVSLSFMKPNIFTGRSKTKQGYITFHFYDRIFVLPRTEKNVFFSFQFFSHMARYVTASNKFKKFVFFPRYTQLNTVYLTFTPSTALNADDSWHRKKVTKTIEHEGAGRSWNIAPAVMNRYSRIIRILLYSYIESLETLCVLSKGWWQFSKSFCEILSIDCASTITHSRASALMYKFGSEFHARARARKKKERKKNMR